ncbi:MAG TPA: GFA family protein, partial [Acetobacteraceae bacterium]|nr:GFA family protein [Acetobacteraceae bacterium]
MEGAPIVTHACHCRFCQRMSESAFAVNAMIEADRVMLLGDAPEVVHTPSALPAGQKQHRCGRCRVALWSNHSKLGDRIV